jgi:hypothetical protein
VSSLGVILVRACINHEDLKLFSALGTTYETASIADRYLLVTSLHEVKLIADINFSQELVFSLECQTFRLAPMVDNTPDLAQLLIPLRKFGGPHLHKRLSVELVAYGCAACSECRLRLVRHTRNSADELDRYVRL